MPFLSKCLNYKTFDFVFLFLLSALLILYQLGAKSLTTWDEICYAQIAKDMMAHKSWLTTMEFDLPVFEKPPLYFVLTAISYKIFGINEWGARFPAAMAGIGTLFFTYLIGLNLFSRRTALLSALLLLSSIHFFNFSRLATLDMMLTFFTSASIFFFLQAQKDPYYFLGFGLLFALAFFTKGLAGLLPLFIIFLSLLWQRDFFIMKNLFFVGGLCLGIFFIFAWIIYEYIHFGRNFLDGIIFVNFSRMYKTLDAHSGSPFFYIKVIFNKGKIFGGLAFILSSYLALSQLFSKHPLKKNVTIILAWFIATFFIFSFMKTKLHWYIIPIYPALFLLCSHMMTLYIPKKYILVFPMISFSFLIYYQLTNPYAFNDDKNRFEKHMGKFVDDLRPKEKTIFLIKEDENISAKALAFYANMYVEDSPALISRQEHGLFLIKKEKLASFQKKSAHKITLLKEAENYIFVKK